MINFIVYRTSDGVILKTGSCADGDLEAQAGEGHVAIEGEADDATQRIDIMTGAIVDLPPVAPVNTWPSMQITPRQLFIGLARAGLITGAEAVAAATQGAMPATVDAAVSTLPAEAQVEARITWARMSVVMRSDPLVDLLAAAQGLTSAQVDAFFVSCSEI